jgi:hypothetical protein
MERNLMRYLFSVLLLLAGVAAPVGAQSLTITGTITEVLADNEVDALDMRPGDTFTFTFELQPGFCDSSYDGCGIETRAPFVGQVGPVSVRFNENSGECKAFPRDCGYSVDAFPQTVWWNNPHDLLRIDSSGDGFIIDGGPPVHVRILAGKRDWFGPVPFPFPPASIPALPDSDLFEMRSFDQEHFFSVKGRINCFFNCVPPIPHRRPLFRYNNPSPDVLDHFYTASFAEIGCGANRWWYEGTIGEVLDREQPGTAALYRFWNPAGGNHFYTTVPDELAGGPIAYVAEGILGYIFRQAEPGTIPLYRWYNGDPAVVDHLYTTYAGEQPGGYVFEGITGYVYPPRSQESCPRSDLTVGDIEPVQVVYGADLVRGKSTAYRVRVDASDCITLASPQFGPIEVTIVQEGISYSQTVTYADFSIVGATCSAFTHIRAGTGPQQGDRSEIRAVVDTNFAVNEGNFGNNVRTRNVVVRVVPGLSVVYVPFGGCDLPTSSPSCYSEVLAASRHVQRNDAFVRATFPLAENGYTSSIAAPYLGSPIPLAGLYQDVLNVACTRMCLTSRYGASDRTPWRRNSWAWFRTTTFGITDSAITRASRSCSAAPLSP